MGTHNKCFGETFIENPQGMFSWRNMRNISLDILLSGIICLIKLADSIILIKCLLLIKTVNGLMGFERLRS